MKVAHFLPHYPGREGTTAFCRGLCEALNRDEPGSSEVWSYKKQTADGEGLVRSFSGKRHHAFDLPRDLRGFLSERGREYSGVVLHGAFNPPMAAMGRALRKCKIPYIFMPHDPYAEELMDHGRLKKSIYWHLFEKRLIAGAEGVILLSASHEQPLRKRGYRGKVEIVPNGCDPASPFHGRKIWKEGEPTVIQYLGRMDRNHKGLDLLIEGFQKFISELNGAPVKLVLSGNDWFDRNHLETIASDMKIQESVTFTGARSESAMEIFSEADMAVLTSRFDGFGLTIVEAMLAGCPVMVTRTCGVASHVEESEGGWTVEPSAAAIGEGFKRAWQERAGWEARGESARKFVLGALTWEQAAKRSARVYGEWFGLAKAGNRK